MSWIPWKEDVANVLKSEVKPKFIVLHPMSIDLVVSSLDAKAEAELKKDHRFMVVMLALCKNHSKDAVQKMKNVLKHADKQAEGFTTDVQMASLFLRGIHMEMEKYFDDGCVKIHKEVSTLFAKKRKEEEYLKKCSIKIDLDLKFGGLEIPQKGGQKKVMAAVKLPRLDVDLTKDLNLKELKTLVGDVGDAAEDVLKKLVQLEDILEYEARTSTDEEKERVKEMQEDCTGKLNTFIALHKRRVDEAVMEWKKQAKPLKEADQLIDEWEKDVADNKSGFPPAAKSAIQTELTKVKRWSGPLTKTRVALTTALKDSTINKKLVEARDQVLEKKTSWTKATDAAITWQHELKSHLALFERELKNSSKMLEESVKKIGKLVSEKR